MIKNLKASIIATTSRRRHAAQAAPAEMQQKAYLRMYGHLWGERPTMSRCERARDARRRVTQ